jgi:flagellar hook assembly protein FlgD
VSGIGGQDNLSRILANTQFAAYPNPFRSLGNVAWSVKTAGKVTLKVYDASGRVVRNLVQSAMKPGRYSVTWNGKANDGRMVSAGIYFYKLETASGKSEQKVILTR